ncbi:hypothetical protein JXB22_10040 [candidate division WOR-3 bacterium]|nr:hypothetical protein [candidate division WOR-3 bacterium]
MKSTIFACIVTFIILIVGCAGPSEPKVYTHEQAHFSVTCPAGWSLISQDGEMFEFRSGDVKLIEVGGFDFGLTSADFEEMSDSEFKDWMKDASLGGLEGYCSEAEIQEWTIDEQYHATWGGLEAYRVRAQGFSNAADVDMVVDLVAAINLDNGMLYMFASQIAKSQYEGAKKDMDAALTSFRVN